MDRREKIIVLGMTLLALCLRVIFLLAMKAHWPGWNSPTIDALYHHLWALQIADGNILGSGPFFRAPLYPYFLALLYTIFGTNFTIVLFIQHLIGVTAVPLVFIIAKRYFGSTTAYIAAGLTVINGTLIYFESQLLLDFMTVIFMLLTLLLLDSGYRQKRNLIFLAVGLVTGIHAITRPNILAVLPLIFLWILTIDDKLKSKIKFIVLLTIGTLIIILPITFRNIIVGKDNVLIASQGGINFYIGNNEKADGMTALLPGFGHGWHYTDAEYEVSQGLGKKIGTIKPSEVSDYYTNKTLNFIINHPGQFRALLIKKLYMFWNYFSISNNNNLYFLTDYIGMSFIPLNLFAIISPLGLIGMILCFKRNRRYWIFPILIFGYMLTVIAFFITARFRLPLIPILTITAAYAITEFISYLKQKDYKKSFAFIIAIVFIGIFAWSNFYDHHDKSMGKAHYSVGNMFIRAGKQEEAKAEYKTALANGDRVPDANVNLGVIAFYEKDNAAAERYFKSELALCGPNAKAYNNLSMLARLEGDYNHSLDWADSAINNFPNFKEAYINLILAAFAINDSLKIKQAVDNFIDIYPDDAASQYYYGMYNMQYANKSVAEQCFNKSIQASYKDFIAEYDLTEIYTSSLPYGYSLQRIRGKNYYQLGLLAAGKNDMKAAINNFTQAAAFLTDDPDALENLALAYDQAGDSQNAVINFQKALTIDSTNATYYYNYAMALGKLRDYQNAGAMLETALKLQPDFPQAQQVLAALKSHLNE